ncbi:MAG: hypothetical protein FH756_10800 [Firmicutes bacterium]|nr:hypothetical protein [Bacillota bacterium]
MNVNKKNVKQVWQDNTGFSEFVAPIIKAIIALTGGALVLTIIYTGIKVLASNTAQNVINLAP